MPSKSGERPIIAILSPPSRDYHGQRARLDTGLMHQIRLQQLLLTRYQPERCR
ncbi:hypothetical protein [Kistimonas asteriae]|uniref:hypothetical protein n=1 Tax=Kistimonas asteriae TaxID=517724 RepID=UPI001BACF4BA|nr:hypothetical protein [Kistimonas asteriae]